jgi:hypothetical protein
MMKLTKLAIPPTNVALKYIELLEYGATTAIQREMNLHPQGRPRNTREPLRIPSVGHPDGWEECSNDAW